jgi:hypothetical protein
VPGEDVLEENASTGDILIVRSILVRSLAVREILVRRILVRRILVSSPFGGQSCCGGESYDS